MSIKTNDAYVGIAKQTAKGTPAATSDMFVKYSEANIMPEIDTTPLREGGDDEQVATVVKNTHREKFTIKSVARPQLVAYWYAWFLGADAKSSTSDPYTHELTRLAGGRAWLTIFRKIQTGSVMRYTDAKIESITCEAEAGQPWMITIEGSSLIPLEQTAEEVPVVETTQPFVFYDSEGAFNLEGVTSDIKKVSVKMTVASQAGMQTDALTIEDLPDLKIDGEVSLELYVADKTRFMKANYNNTTGPDPDNYTSAFSFNNIYEENTPNDRQFKMEIGKFLWNVVDLPIKGDPETNVETIAGIIMAPAAGEWAKVTVKNSLSADLI